jgi:hypothetical protein
MGAAKSTNTTNSTPSNYHTVTICADLPKIKKDYTIDKIKDVPPSDYWLNKMDEKVDRKFYKIQHVIANGPRKQHRFLIFFITLDLLLFRYIIN